MRAHGYVADTDGISPSNIDDIIWYAKARGITRLSVLPSQLNPIWQFLAANVGVGDTELRREYFVEGKVRRILGVDLDILPPAYLDVPSDHGATPHKETQ